MIPFLDLKAQYESIKDEINQKILEIISSQKFVLGPEVEHLEEEIASFCGVRSAIGVSSGSDALIISLMALEIGDGDEVITTPFTFFATAGSISRVKAKPVFCDIEEKSFNISPEKLEEILETQIDSKGNTNIKAILPVHLFGQCADMDPILDLAEIYGIDIIEDGCQSIGAEYPSMGRTKKVCSMGTAGTLSFFPSKNLGGFGDGGMVLSNDESFVNKANLLRVHGSKDAFIYDILGGNFRLDAIQAGVLRVKLKYLEKWQNERKERAAYYDRKFIETGLVDEDLITIPIPIYKPNGVTNYHVYNQYVLRVKKRDELKIFLENTKISTAIYYPLPLHLQKCFSCLEYKKGDFPEAEKAASEVLSLPVYPELSGEQQDYIVSSINDFYQK